MKIYRTKISYSLLLSIIGFTILPIVPIMIIDFSFIALAIVASILFLALYTIFSITYSINNEILTVKVGVFQCNQYIIKDIIKIQNTNSILASPASSLDRIAIYFKHNKSPLIISPQHKDDFIQNLLDINPEIRYI